MPELPEVEHTRKNLVRWMKGARIAAVQTDDARIVVPRSPRAFVVGLAGKTVTGVERRGKWLKLALDDGQRIFAHLGMTGWFELDPPQAPPRRFERVGFDLAKGKTRRHVAYVDPRRWGRMILATEDVAAWTALGPDPLADGIDEARLAAIFARRRRTVKEVLMDQAVLAGVGNIQAIEALWKARIDPRSASSALGRKDVRAIARGLVWTIERTLADLAKGDAGKDNPFAIYGRRGSPCPRCKTALARITLSGRTTTFCPGCQARKSGPRSRRASAPSRPRPRSGSR